ncbi:MAG: SHOCT domain-containing protein, partial [Pseudolabrys sp.]
RPGALALGPIRLEPVLSQGLGRLKATNTENEMLFDGGYTYSNFLMNVLGIFAFVVWFWLLVVIYGDLFRRHDISGWGKALWVIGLVVFSYLGILAYLITQGRGMAERNAQQAQQAREELRRVVGFSVADEISKLDQLKKSGTITDAEFQRLRAKLV